MILFFKKNCNMNYHIGNENGIGKYCFEAIRIVRWLQIEKYYDNIKYFDLYFILL